ncbi:MAG TPA: hypothetical protein VFI11_08610 [Anaerolineales bacterium]|nr:hypothetical protein [Anaerolineales bacterium]
MSAGVGRMKVNELERWLERVLVPVEPSDRFAQRLKARLVTLQGAGPGEGWVLLAAVLMGVVMTVAWMGVALRIALGVLALLGIVQGSRRGKARKG